MYDFPNEPWKSMTKPHAPVSTYDKDHKLHELTTYEDGRSEWWEHGELLWATFPDGTEVTWVEGVPFGSDGMEIVESD